MAQRTAKLSKKLCDSHQRVPRPSIILPVYTVLLLYFAKKNIRQALYRQFAIIKTISTANFSSLKFIILIELEPKNKFSRNDADFIICKTKLS